MRLISIDVVASLRPHSARWRPAARHLGPNEKQRNETFCFCRWCSANEETVVPNPPTLGVLSAPACTSSSTFALPGVSPLRKELIDCTPRAKTRVPVRAADGRREDGPRPCGGDERHGIHEWPRRAARHLAQASRTKHAPRGSCVHTRLLITYTGAAPVAPTDHMHRETVSL